MPPCYSWICIHAILLLVGSYAFPGRVITETGEDTPEMIVVRIEGDEGVPTTTVMQDNTTNTTTPSEHVTTTSPEPGGKVTEEKVDPLSVVWYLGAFGGLIAFFLVVTCSEWCCGHRPYGGGGRGGSPSGHPSPYGAAGVVPQTPPPPYHLFAPPDYQETIKQDDKSPSVYIVPLPAT